MKLQQCVKLFKGTTSAPAGAWLRLMGLMASMVDLISWCRLRMQPIQLHLLSFFFDPVAIQFTMLYQSHPYYAHIPITHTSPMVGTKGQPWERDNIPSSPPIRDHINGRLSDRMGGHPDTTSSGRNMGNRLPNICYGNVGSRQSFPTLHSVTNQAVQIRCNNATVHQPSRGHTIEPVVSPHVAITQLVRNTGNYANRSTCTCFRQGE